MARNLIVGTGSSLPSKIVTNEELSKLMETSDEWIRTRTGISERRIVLGEETTSSLALSASKRAVQKAGIDPKEINLTIVATTSSDYSIPSTACIIQKELGYSGGAAFDLSAACSGFVYAMAVASSFMDAGAYDTTLIVGVDSLSRIMDWSDKTTSILFGDGAGAVVLTQGEANGYGFLGHLLGSDGSGAEMLYASQILPGTSPFGAVSKPDTFPDNSGFLRMNGRETFKFAVRVVVEVAERILKDAGLTIGDVDYFIPHQANSRIVDAAAEALQLPVEKKVCNIDSLGNTSAASIPIALDHLSSQSRLKDGDLILMVGFGGGLTWGASLYRWKGNG